MISTMHGSTIHPDHTICSLLTLDQFISAVHSCVNPPQNEECETLHEGYSNTTTTLQLPISSKAVAVKVINPEKNESKLLMLRNIDTDKLDSPCDAAQAHDF